MVKTVGNICVSVACAQADEAVAVARQSENLADVIEIRLDTLLKPEITLFTDRLSGPLLFTNRPEWEGGSFAGPEAQRVGLLQQAVRQGCSLVDLELNTAPALRGELLDILLQHPETELVISWHDFSGTPSMEELGEILQQQMESGAHIGKIVTMANDHRDVLRVLNLLAAAEENSFPLIAFCMGAAGRISRLATVKLGGFMTYAAPDKTEGAAPGQLKVSVIHEMLTRLDNAD